MALRYPLALAAAYLVFLLLLQLWLRTKAEDYADVPDLSDLLARRAPGDALPPLRSGGGGDFAGGGAEGSFDAEAPRVLPLARTEARSSLGDAVGGAADANEVAIPLLAILFALGLALAALYVVYLAPALFAEMLVDGGLVLALHRRLRRGETRSWVATALRRTALPFALTAVFLALAGAGLAALAPGARSIGEALHSSAAPR